MRVLHVLDVLDSHDSARQVQLLGPALAADAVSIDVCCLGTETPATAALREAGVHVHALGWTRWLDLGAVRRLRALLRDARPDVIHVWSLTGVRMLAIAGRAWLGRTVFSAAPPAKGTMAWHDRWLLRQVRSIAVAGAHDQACIRDPSGAGPAIHIVPPAVASAPRAETPPREATFSIAFAGPLEGAAGAQTAVWTFDIVRYLFPDARLHILGAGSQEANLRSLIAGWQNDAVRFLGDPADRTASLRSAEVIWIPSLTNCGRQTALEAMAQGRPVIASQVPCLAEVIRDGVTGLLVPPGDVVALARRTRLLFEDADLRHRLGNAARAAVLQRFPLRDTVARWQDVYRRVAA